MTSTVLPSFDLCWGYSGHFLINVSNTMLPYHATGTPFSTLQRLSTGSI